jgi:hypothetical protein
MTTVRGNSEVKAMRRTLQPLLAATAGLSLLLSACSGESPTSPKPPTDGGSGGTCTVTIALDATSVTPMAGTAIILRATVRKGGAIVPDGTAVLFTTDFGFFLETGLPSVSKVTQNGFADVTLGATASGLSKVKATFECGTAEKSIDYQPVPSNGPFISSITPTSGSCAGGDSVTINGGRFGGDSSALRVSFGGNPATIQSLADSKVVVLTPSRTLANPQVPEAVDVMIQFFTNDAPTGHVTASKAFTYYCVDPNKRMTLRSLTPVSGSPDGGQQVTISGNNFLPTTTSSAATTRVTFGGAPASVLSATNTQITALTPRRILANPNVPETVDVAVTVDLGLVSQQSAMLPQAYTYRAGGAGDCVGGSGLFIATVLPEDPANAGSPDGGDIVVLSGGGFTAGGSSTTLDQTDVFFGGVQGVTLSVTDSEVRVTTPRRILANPDKPETVDVRLVTDAGGPSEGCVQANGAYTYYPGGYLEPIITSLSPTIGPNDISTRVTMFGRNFKLPMQVFVRAGGFTTEATVVSITASQIIFLTPVASGPNSALAGQAADVLVRDPYAGKEFVSPVQFRYYSCPTANAVVPASAPWNFPTVVTISGQNFEEPVEVAFTSGNLLLRPTVTSVSSSLITVLMPAIDPGLGEAVACQNVQGELEVKFPALASCEIEPLDFTYRVDAMTATSASPTQLNQAGGPFGAPITDPAATITVLGTNFVDPMTVQLIKNGSVVANTTVNNAIVANTGQLSFAAPPVPDNALNEQPCVPLGGTTLTGVRWVPTSFGIRLRNTRTGCSVDLPNVLIYNPIEPGCRSGIGLTQVAAPVAATLCQAYTSGTFAVTGGIPTPNYAISLTTGPPGVAPSPATLAVAGSFTLAGTPALAANGPGQASTTYAGTLVVTDGAPLTTDATLGVSITVTDPAAPFAANATATTLSALAASASVSSTVSVAPSSIGAVTYTAGTPSPALPISGEVTFTVNPTTGVATLARTAAAPAATGSSTVVVTAADTGCGGTHHQGTVTLTLQY